MNWHRRPLLLRAGALAVLAVPSLTRLGAAEPQATAEGESAAPTEVPIGLIHPMHGPFAPFGRRCRHAAELAIQAINDAGGIASLEGLPLVAQTADLASDADPQTITEAMQAFAEAQVVAVIGAATSPLTARTTREAATLGLAHLIDGALDPGLTGEESPGIFRLGPDFDALMDRLANVIEMLIERLEPPAAVEGEAQAEPPLHRVALVRDPGAWGTRVAEHLATRLAEAPLRLDPVLDLAAHETSLSPLAYTLRREQPALVVVVAYEQAQRLLMATLAEREISLPGLVTLLGPLTSGSGFEPEDWRQWQGLIDVTIWPDPQAPETAVLSERFAEAGIPVTADTVIAHESVRLLADAIERAASLERPAVLAALGESGWQSPCLPFAATSFAAGRNEAALPAVMQVQDGRLVLTDPQGDARPALIFPT